MIYKNLLTTFFAFFITLVFVVSWSVKDVLADPAVSLFLQPANGDIVIGGLDKVVEFKITPNGRQVVAVQIGLEYIYDDITITSATINSSLSGDLTEMADSHDGIKKYALTFTTPITQGVTLATFNLKAVRTQPKPNVDVLLGNAKVILENSNDPLTTSNGGVGVQDAQYNVVTATASPSPSPSPSGLSCSAFSPGGLADSGQVGPGGIKIYNTADYRGGRRALTVTRSPANAAIQQPTFTKNPAAAPDLTFETAADQSGNWFVNIPDNNSITAENDYTVSAVVSPSAIVPSAGVTASCTPFIIHVPKKMADAVCPTSIRSTEARMRANASGNWSTELSMSLGSTIYVAGFHDNQTETYASDIILTATGPDGPESRVVTLNSATPNNVAFAPNKVGRYTITAAKNGKTGENCTGNAVLTVSAAAVVTTQYRIAENPADLGRAQWQSYTSEPLTVDFEFKDKTPGPKFVWVEFKDSTGKIERRNAEIKLLGADPVIAGCLLSFEGNNTVLNLTGQNFGTVKGEIKSGETTLQAREWKNNSIKAVLPNAPAGQAIPVSLTNTDGQISEGQCSAISLLSLGAKFFCRAPSSHGMDNVDLTLAGAYEGGTRVKQKVKIDKDGVIEGLNVKLESGKNYKLSLKAPKSLRRTDSFTAGDGTTNISNFVLPVGDIFPADGGDGSINSFDKSVLNSQWIISTDVTGRSGDFNQDGRVNSFDWACMRYDFNKSDDSEPTPGGPPASSPNPGAGGSSAATPSPSPSSSPAASGLLRPATNLNFTCSSEVAGSNTTLSWSPVTGATRYILRVDNKANNTGDNPYDAAGGWFKDDGKDIYIDDLPATVGEGSKVRYSFNAVPGQEYRWWLHAGRGTQASSGYDNNVKNSYVDGGTFRCGAGSSPSPSPSSSPTPSPSPSPSP